MIPFLLIVPLIIAMALIGIIPSQSMPKYLALIASLASLGLLFLVPYGVYNLDWFTVGNTGIGISSSINPVSMLLLVVVLLVAPIVFLYSLGFMRKPSEQRRFYIEMLAFEAAMLVFAMSGNYITLFIAWEFLSLMSYLLIGFYHQREEASRAARKAITIVLLGDLAILAALVILWNATGSFSFAALPSNPVSLYAAASLLMIAIFTKSAQFPFQEWLPDAMEGPTPVSAFLHSATMVKAGIFALIILYPLFSAAHMLSVFLWVGIITVILSTLNASKEKQIKRVAAYSTVQELGLMMIAVSIGAITAGIYFFLMQSFYKSLIFFSAGAVMESSGEEDLEKTSGLGQNKLVYLTTLFGVLSLVGFVPFSGFFAAIGIGSSATSIPIYIFLSVIGFSTSFFMFRWLFMASKKSSNPKAERAYATIPRSMVIAMAILAILTLAGSVGFFYLPRFLNVQNFYLNGFLGSLHANFYDPIIETALAILGLLASYIVFVHNKKLYNSLIPIVYNSAAMNWLYSYFARLVYWFAEGVGSFDAYVNDSFDDIGKAIRLSGSGIRRFAVGDINLYVAVFSLALVAVLSYAFITGAL